MYWKLDKCYIDADTGQVNQVYEYYAAEHTVFGDQLSIKQWYGPGLEEFLEFYNKNKSI